VVQAHCVVEWFDGNSSDASKKLRCAEYMIDFLSFLGSWCRSGWGLIWVGVGSCFEQCRNRSVVKQSILLQ
jgi:hypothetical protein